MPLLARYNESMHLGQGFNSFLQVSCIDNAVTFDQSKVVVERANASPAGVSQVVSYSSRFVKKISDVVRSMNISAASLIKSGSIEAASAENPLFVEEEKFASSDLNVVVSVKVVHQTTRLVDPVFQPIEHIKHDKFLDTYGDCYISGFIEGGELHGIVSINIPDALNKRDLEKMIQRQMNSMDSSDSQLASALSQTETVISVNWSGGGQNKPECEEWSLGTILQTAAAFPAMVSSCPRRTWAILTKYDNNRDFLQWAGENKVTIPQYQGIQAYTSNLLDTYMEYKNNIARLQTVLQSPKDYMMSSVDAIPTSTAALINERDKMRKQMGLIVKEIDILCIHPEKIEEIEGKSQIQSAEVWATRLPVQKGTSAGEERFREQVSTADVMESPLVSGTSPQASTIAGAASEGVTPIKIDPLCTPEVEAAMSEHDRAFVTSSENKLKFQSYRFGMICGSATGNPFNDAVELQTALVPVTWPKRIEVDLIRYWSVEDPIVGCYRVYYDQFTLVRGSNIGIGTVVQTLSMDMSYRELITRVKLAKNSKEGFPMVIYVEFGTNQGRWGRVGNLQGSHIIEERPPTGFLGLKGFYGGQGDIVDSMGAIWGQ